MGAAGETDLFGDDGDVLLDDDGKVKICGECCDDECSIESIDITVTGTTTSLCTGCQYTGSGSHIWSDHDDFDGDYTLELFSQSDTACNYFSSDPVTTAMDIEIHDGSVCDDLLVTSSVTFIQAQVSILKNPVGNPISFVHFSAWHSGSQAQYVYLRTSDPPADYGDSVGLPAGTQCDDNIPLPFQMPALGATVVVDDPAA